MVAGCVEVIGKALEEGFEVLLACSEASLVKAIEDKRSLASKDFLLDARILIIAEGSGDGPCQELVAHVDLAQMKQRRADPASNLSGKSGFAYSARR